MFPDLEFIKTMLNGLRIRIEKAENWFMSNRPNWEQNDPEALDYVKGRTHYEANGKVVQLPPKFLPSPTSNTAGAIKADAAKTTDIQSVRLGTDGKLYSSGIPIFTTSGTGVVYTANVPEITELVAGMLVVMIPHTNSTTISPRLAINGGIHVYIYRPLSSGNTSGWNSIPNLRSGIPYLLIYTGSRWLSINNVQPNGLDLLNFVSPEQGGTGRTSLPAGSYLVGNNQSSVQLKTPSEVLADIGAIPVPATAEVGQTIVVKAVDDMGKPTEWEAVDMPSGGSGGKQLLYRHNISQDTVLTTDSFDTSGANIDLSVYSHLYIRGMFICNSPKETYGFFYLNGTKCDQIKYFNRKIGQTVGFEADIICLKTQNKSSAALLSFAWCSEFNLQKFDNIYAGMGENIPRVNDNLQSIGFSAPESADIFAVKAGSYVEVWGD